MKKLLFIVICFSVIGQSNAQEIFKVPEKTLEQKHNRMIHMNWANVTPAIRFAKTQNVSPYEYGQFVGSLYARGWTASRGFKGYAQSFLRNWEYFRPDTEPEIVIEFESDSMLVFKVPSSILTKSFGEDGMMHGVTLDEMITMMNGSHSQISKKLGCASKMVLKGKWIVTTIKKL